MYSRLAREKPRPNSAVRLAERWTNPKAKGSDPHTFVDNSVIKEIEASGFIRDLYAK